MARSAHYYASFNPGRVGDNIRDVALRNLRRLAPVAAILVTRLYECYDESHSVSDDELLSAIQLIEGYVFRRAICGLETRGYWTVFAGIAYRIDPQNPWESLRVEFARLRENYRFPSDEEFKKALTEREVYGLRVCWYLLDRLENAGRKEASDTRGYSIEHIMPQNEKLSLPWRRMLGPDWRRVHEVWLHRLGNLTLTGYNSTYQDRPFEEKKTIPGGFNESAVRLNKYVREQSQWTAKEMEARGEELGERALKIWSALEADQGLVKEADVREKRELASRRDVTQVQMSPTARKFFDTLSDEIKRWGDVIELAEGRSVSYHAPNFFLEVLPRKYELHLLLPLDFSEVHDPNEIAEDTSQRTFIPNANHDGGVLLYVWDQKSVEAAIPIIRQAYNTSAR
jgi:predicted transport protein